MSTQEIDTVVAVIKINRVTWNNDDVYCWEVAIDNVFCAPPLTYYSHREEAESAAVAWCESLKLCWQVNGD